MCAGPRVCLRVRGLGRGVGQPHGAASDSHTGHDAGAGAASASESHTKSGKDTGHNL